MSVLGWGLFELLKLRKYCAIAVGEGGTAYAESLSGVHARRVMYHSGICMNT
jgi:hypothetical protein